MAALAFGEGWLPRSILILSRLETALTKHVNAPHGAHHRPAAWFYFQRNATPPIPSSASWV